MTDLNKETVWITIPDEASPALESAVKVIKKESHDKVKNKAFWGGGFVALVAFAALLLAPQEIAGLMQAQLFDGTFQVVPDFEEQQSGTLFGDGTVEEGTTETTTTTTTTTSTDNQNVVEAEAEAVTIQIDPVSDTGTEDTTTTSDSETETTTTTTTTTTTDASTTTGEAGAEAATDAEPIAVDGTDDTGVVTDGTATDSAEELDANAKLLQSLSKQLEDYKDQESRNEQMIQDLMQLLEDQAAGVHGAADTATGATFLPAGQDNGQIGTQGVGQSGYGTGVIGAGAGVYRYNTHTVSVSPYDILAQNKGAIQQASYQANVAYNGVQAYSNQAYNPVLANIQGQPDTGPTEVFLFAFAIASLGVLVWGSMRAIRA